MIDAIKRISDYTFGFVSLRSVVVINHENGLSNDPVQTLAVRKDDRLHKRSLGATLKNDGVTSDDVLKAAPSHKLYGNQCDVGVLVKFDGRLSLKLFISDDYGDLEHVYNPGWGERRKLQTVDGFKVVTGSVRELLGGSRHSNTKTAAEQYTEQIMLHPYNLTRCFPGLID